jgi:hypothetical protein
MKEDYPSFDKKETREEYSKVINDIFRNRNFDWTSMPAIASPYVFVRPNSHEIPPQLNTEAHPFKDIAKIAIGTKEGIARLGVIAYPSMEDSVSKRILEKIGYSNERIDNQEKFFLLVKSIDSLEYIVTELEDMNQILARK